MAATIIGIEPSDEVIVPSYTFVTSANAFVQAGASIVFVDIKSDTLGISLDSVRRSITKRTKAVIAVHYAGLDCGIEQLSILCKEYGLYLIEDAAQGFLSRSLSKRYLGTYGDLGCYSFHETKNISCGEGGALVVNNKSLLDKALITYEKGTDRRKYMMGHVDKYTWHDKGGSYALSELLAACLLAQLEKSEWITNQRRKSWAEYRDLLGDENGLYRISSRDLSNDFNNAHIFYLLMNCEKQRNELIRHLNEKSIMAVFHYIPLHDSPGGKRFGWSNTDIEYTSVVSKTIVRLPLWVGVNTNEVAEQVLLFCNNA